MEAARSYDPPLTDERTEAQTNQSPGPTERDDFLENVPEVSITCNIGYPAQNCSLAQITVERSACGLSGSVPSSPHVVPFPRDLWFLWGIQCTTGARACAPPMGGSPSTRIPSRKSTFLGPPARRPHGSPALPWRLRAGSHT